MLLRHLSCFCPPLFLSLLLGGPGTCALGKKPVVLHWVHGQDLMFLKGGICPGSCDHFGSWGTCREGDRKLLGPQRFTC